MSRQLVLAAAALGFTALAMPAFATPLSAASRLAAEWSRGPETNATPAGVLGSHVFAQLLADPQRATGSSGASACPAVEPSEPAGPDIEWLLI